MSLEDSELLLIERSKQGDRQAFEQIVNRYYNSIYQLLYHFLRNAEDAEDLTQEVFLESYRCLKNFLGKSKFYTWLYRIATNLGINHIKRKKKFLSLDEMSPSGASFMPFPSGAMEKEEFYNDFSSALEKLSEDKKLIFLLREVQGLSYQEISEVANIKIGTVMSRLSRAREEMREALEDHYGE